MRKRNADIMPSVRDSSSDADEGLDCSFIQPTRKSMYLNDMVHRHVELPLLCSKIINTPQFDRLRHLKQLGLCYQVYPSASHNRFEHCIGTAYLAGKYGRMLQQNQPELDIDEKDILCLYVAGLCHDLGHGPFSHTWEKFMHEYDPNYSHEEMSLRMFDFLIEDNNLGEHFRSNGLEDDDLIFIKECIVGHPLSGDNFQGRDASKHFLYQIVNNEETKIDVDKYDYLLRDCKQLHLRTAFDYERVVENSRVHSFNEDGYGAPRMKIVYRKKISDTLEDLFRGRFRMHQTAYQHRVTKVIETMVLDGLHAAEPYFKVTGRNGNEYRISTAYKDISAFMKLTDSIFEIIMYWNGDVCREAKDIFTAILQRNLYKYFGYVAQPPEGEALKDLKSISPCIKLIPTKIDYGKGECNPLNDVWFYEKSKPDKVFKCDFPATKVERKCFIVYTKICADKSDSESLTSSTAGTSSDLKRKLQDWSTDHGIEIQME